MLKPGGSLIWSMGSTARALAAMNEPASTISRFAAKNAKRSRNRPKLHARCESLQEKRFPLKAISVSPK